MSETNYIKDLESSLKALKSSPKGDRRINVVTKLGFSANGIIHFDSSSPGGFWVDVDNYLHFIPFDSIDHLSMPKFK